MQRWIVSCPVNKLATWRLKISRQVTTPEADVADLAVSISVYVDTWLALFLRSCRSHKLRCTTLTLSNCLSLSSHLDHSVTFEASLMMNLRSGRDKRDSQIAAALALLTLAHEGLPALQPLDQTSISRAQQATSRASRASPHFHKSRSKSKQRPLHTSANQNPPLLLREFF